MAEHGNLIFVVTFLGVFIFLSGFIPSPFFFFLTYDQTQYKPLVVPDKWDTSAIGEGTVLDQDMANITYPSATSLSLEDEEIILFWADYYPYNPDLPSSKDEMWLAHIHTWWIFVFWEPTDANPFTKAYLNSIQDENNVSSVTVRCLKGDLQFLFQITFDNNMYSSFIDAWDNNHLEVYVAIRQADTQTQAHYDAWTLIGQLLTFQAPFIHPLFNFIIAVPIWISIALAIIYVLDKILPF